MFWYSLIPGTSYIVINGVRQTSRFIWFYFFDTQVVNITEKIIFNMLK